MCKCEKCGKEHNGKYGSGRFCSEPCARSYSSNINRDETNIKVADTLFRKHHNNKSKQEYIQQKNADKHASYIRENEVASILDLSKRTAIKIIKRMKLPCSLCGWQFEDVSGDVHHIILRKDGGSNEHNNLTYVCPNCHRLIHSNKIDKNSLITLDKQIGDEWKKFYYVKNGDIHPKID